jgi:hypothetical protein
MAQNMKRLFLFIQKMYVLIPVVWVVCDRYSIFFIQASEHEAPLKIWERELKKVEEVANKKINAWKNRWVK